MDLNGKVAWVVGASSGIGAAVARELRSRGARVAISARRHDLLAAVSAGNMLVVAADVTNPEALAAAAELVRKELGPIDLVILSAGYWKQMDAHDWDTETFDKIVQINLVGMSNAVATVLPEMLSRRSGLIAGIASVAGYRGLAGSEAYGATKAAQINLLEALRISLARSGVRVTTICPGFVHTELTAENAFRMPFIIEADEAGRSICDGLERDRMDRVPQTDGCARQGNPPHSGARVASAVGAELPYPNGVVMRLRKVVVVDQPVDKVFDYLSDFTTTTEWDPGTVKTVRVAGNGGVGTEYLNTSMFAGRQTELTYVVQELVPNLRIALRGENKTVVAHDMMTFRSVPGGNRAGARTEVTYTADFAFKGIARVIAPFLKPAFAKLGTEAETGLMRALARL